MTQQLIRSVQPDAAERLYPAYKTIGHGHGTVMSGLYCYIAPLKDRVNLGFHKGTELPDPGGLLEGMGKGLRHVKLKKPADLDNPTLRTLLEAAWLIR